jgi:hypothetical protein
MTCPLAWSSSHSIAWRARRCPAVLARSILNARPFQHSTALIVPSLFVLIVCSVVCLCACWLGPPRLGPLASPSSDRPPRLEPLQLLASLVPDRTRLLGLAGALRLSQGTLVLGRSGAQPLRHPARLLVDGRFGPRPPRSSAS